MVGEATAGTETDGLVEKSGTAEFAGRDRNFGCLQHVAWEQPGGERQAVDGGVIAQREGVADCEAKIDGPAKVLAVSGPIIVEIDLGDRRSDGENKTEKANPREKRDAAYPSPSERFC